MTLAETKVRHAEISPGVVKLGRRAGAAWFLLFAALNARGLIAMLADAPVTGVPFAVWAAMLARACNVAFFLILAWLMLARPTPVARTGLVPQMVALLGTYGVWVIGFLPGAPLPPALNLLSAAATLVGGVMIVYVIIHLGRSFSIAPQARTLVTHGPYRLVRNPLYAAEEIAIIGVAMHFVWWAAVPIVLAHIALQLRRMAYEERLLRSVFPDYAAYAERTARLIPGVW